MTAPRPSPTSAASRTAAGRQVLSRAWRRTRAAMERADPSRLTLQRDAPLDGIGLVCVYRSANVTHVRRLVRRLPASAVRLWSLDGQAPEDLRNATVGTGPGTRLALLDRLVEALDPSDRRRALVLADDDVRFTVGGLGALVAAGQACGLDLYQPAHLASSFASWSFNHRRPLVVVRRVDYVEQGPVVVLSSRAQQALLPLPQDLGMGWGVEARWWRTGCQAGLVLGIVDAVAVQHLVRPGRGYDRGAQEVALAREVQAAGLRDISDLHREHDRLWAWDVARGRRLGPY